MMNRTDVPPLASDNWRLLYEKRHKSNGKSLITSMGESPAGIEGY